VVSEGYLSTFTSVEVIKTRWKCKRTDGEFQSGIQKCTHWIGRSEGLKSNFHASILLLVL